MIKKIFILFIGLLSINLNAQNEIDALRYSEYNIFGTAKFNSMGGSFGALGGDFTTLSYNPAGISLYQNSELSLTPSLSIVETKTSLNERKSLNNKFGSSISNFGYVSTGKNLSNDWTRINFGFGWNQLASYDNKFHLTTSNSQTSFADLLLDQANGVTINNLNSFGASTAFWANIIDLENNFVDTATEWYAFDNGNYISHVNPLSEKTQTDIVNSRGNTGEYVVSLGGSFQEKIYFGATIGIPTIQYSENKTYSESNFADTTFSLRSFSFKEDLLAYGSGINMKIGAIFRLGSKTKIGGAIHTPSYISMDEEYSTSATTTWDNGDVFSESSPYGYFSYEITTPWKIIGSFSTIFKNRLLINAEIERTDYSFTRMYSDYYSFTEENKQINDTYTEATNIRFGGEANLDPFKLRAGYALYGSPYKNHVEYETENYSAGIGIDFGRTFFDMSYTLSKKSGDYAMYSPNTEPNASINSEKHYLLFTLGFRY